MGPGQEAFKWYGSGRITLTRFDWYGIPTKDSSGEKALYIRDEGVIMQHML